MRHHSIISTLLFISLFITIACADESDYESSNVDEISVTGSDVNTDDREADDNTNVDGIKSDEDNQASNDQDETNLNAACDGELISAQASEEILELTYVSDPAEEDIYSTFNRIDKIAAIFETCGDPWGLFPTTYRHITRRIIQAIENEQIEDTQWGKEIVVDFAGRYLANLREAMIGGKPSYAWRHYYYLAGRDDVSRTRAVVIAMVAHLTLDLPYALVAIDSTEDHKDDYFVLGELMIEITPYFIEDLRVYYGTDAEAILNGFFFGNWIDGAFGSDTTITLSYQTIRTKSWNNRWYLEKAWGKWVATSEIYTSFWTIDGILATLDRTGVIQ